ncbi:RsmF rRNA methyltransferase first C-terminal domain-containing protein [Bacillus sp. BRMEA1]|uniref:RsmF rRNA methyltransferase first C-terminal domain-containing protein n=1 Tax=Neobacillus endophyticus TaxID=2738405 RepID=UPI001564EA78|nr:RsmB/NOP family class I SAM-dependent RNA methyltransferase [Neobacillus endophyticus]NRD77767.1 RsmF rRNA methyltransferase first C-terminal domain-containing protein [Neobacillus endophyticus]
MELPLDFLVKMRELLQDEYEAFIQSYEEHKAQGLRANTLKVSLDEFLKISPFTLKKIPWVKEGFYYGAEERPGKHPYHEAGLYYIQEPSAMAAGELLDPQPGEKVLDLCAAPGGKTTHIAARMNQQGLLLTNEIHPARAKILSQNIERMGVRNAVVTNETPARLAERFPGYFDRIMVDAPCSGEGMFRKDPEACQEWSLENVAICAARQLDILEYAGGMLRPGGRLVYSTCTFSPEENEGTISRFLQEHPNFEVEAAHVYEGFDTGRADWIPEAVASIEKTVRIWPHHIQGEGHYIAVLRKTSGEEPGKRKYAKPLTDQKLLKSYFQFAEETLIDPPKGDFLLFGEQLYLMPKDILTLDHLKVLRPGWHLGTIKKNRFEPSHALALSLHGSQVKNKWNIGKDSREIISYLKGESLEAEGTKGWYLVEVDSYSLGWGKLSDNVLKNHYPKGLRWAGNR